MERINTVVEMKKIYSYERSAYARYGTETAYIYNMEAEDGTVYVWKTTTFMGFDVEDSNGHTIKKDGKTYGFCRINKGDKIRIAATVKGESEYNGQPQTELTRVKVLERIFKAKTWEEIQAEREAAMEKRREEQIASLTDGDIVWRMPYKQYKEHYSDCETLEGSFEEASRRGVATIAVIIRDGRLKPSGVRGKHYSGYRMENENGEWITYYAISEETATKRANREFPGHRWECTKVYEYSNGYEF